MNVKIVEEKIGTKLEDLTEEKLLEIVKNNDIVSKLFNNLTDMIDFLDLIMERNRNKKDFLKELFTVRCMIEMRNNENIIDGVFKRYRENVIDRENLKTSLFAYIESDDPLFSISAVICCLISMEDLDITKYQKTIEENLEKIKFYFQNFGRIENSYLLRCDIIDLIYTLRSMIFERYGIELNIEWVDEECKTTEQYEIEFLNNRELPAVNMKPEDLGFIDITKLKKE